MINFVEADSLYPFLRKMQREGKLDYDGIVVDESIDAYTPSYVPLQSEQIKEVTNKAPTKDKDIRYSLKDSKGNELSEQQAEFLRIVKLGMRTETCKLFIMAQMVILLYLKKKGGKRQVLLSEYNVDSKGFFFATDKNYAENFGKRVGSYYINITNPLIYKKYGF